MADAAVSMLMEPLISNLEEWLKEEISLIKNVKNKLKEVSSKLRAVQDVLDDAEKQSVTKESVKNWLDELKYISYDMDDVLDEWNTSVSKRKLEEPENPPDVPTEKISCSSFFTSCISPVKHVGVRRDIAWKIKDIDSRLDSVVKQMDQFKFDINQKSSVDDSLKTNRITNSIIKVSETYGREFDEQIILSKLLAEGSSHDQVNRKIPIISIVGVGGLGKTTLAKLVYNNDEVVKSFGKRIWVCVSDPFDMNKTAREIVAALGGSAPSDSSQDLLLRKLRELILNVKFLLVLDDVWDEEGKSWDDLRICLENCAFGSRVIVTTRKKEVAKVMGTSTTNLYNLSQLSEGASWSLFSQIAFDEEKKDHEMITRIGKEIVTKCKGLPLAVRTLGNVLRLKSTIEEWERVLNSEIWEIEKVEVELFPHLYLSYNELSPALKKCFSYCSLFPKDTRMVVDDLIKFWMAQGYVTSKKGECDVEIKGKEYFDKLATRCFFQEFENDDFGNIISCKMHDIVHDFALYLTRNESITTAYEIQNSFSEKVCHVFLMYSERWNNDPPLNICNGGNLRSFIVHNHVLHQPVALIRRLECLRSLVLKRCILKELPKEIGSLVHLRLLNLSYNDDLHELPESICELFNLQTLNITYCLSLKRLPERIGKLINLRHLLIGNVYLENYPKSFERLTNLRTLTDFIVGRKYGKFEYLKKFKHLHGDLNVKFDSSDLEVTELVADAEKTQLRYNKNIQYLDLMFKKEEAGMEALWEALLPPTNLQSLGISNFFETEYPSWLTNKSHFNNLRMLCIDNFIPKTLPPLWKLSCLETLVIKSNDSIKHIGREFLGIEDIVDSGDNNLSRAPASSSSSLVAFPKLVSLSFKFLGELEEWEDLNEEHDEPEVDTTTNKIEILPRLQKLTIWGSKKLHQLPHRLLRKASSLEYLEIWKCGMFTNNEEDDTESYRQQLLEQLLSHIPKIQVDDVIYTPDNKGGSRRRRFGAK